MRTRPGSFVKSKDKFIYILMIIYAFGGIGIELLKLYSSRFDNSFFSERTSVEQHSILLVVLSTFMYSFYIFLFRQYVYTMPNKKTASVAGLSRNSKEKILHFIKYSIFILLIFYILFHFMYLEKNIVDRHEGNQVLNRFITFYSLALLGVNLFFTNRLMSVKSLLLFIFSFTYSAATASRAVSLPFFVVSFVFLLKKRWIASFLFVLLALKALAAAFQIRGDPSFVNYIAVLFEFSGSGDFFDLVADIVVLSFPGASTMQIVLDSGLEREGLLQTLVYLSPLPSFLIPDAALARSSLSDALGIDINILGINSDIISEPYYRQGLFGVILFPAYLVLLYVLMLKLSNRILLKARWNVFWFPRVIAIYSLIGGMVFSYRAATRYQIYFLIFGYIFLLYLKKKQIK